MPDKAALERFLEWRKVDPASWEIVLDPSILHEALKRCRFETPTKIDVASFSDEQLSTAVQPLLAAERVYGMVEFRSSTNVWRGDRGRDCQTLVSVLG